MEDNFSTDLGEAGWFGADSNLLHLLCALVGASLVAQSVKNLPAMQETWV